MQLKTKPNISEKCHKTKAGISEEDGSIVPWNRLKKLNKFRFGLILHGKWESFVCSDYSLTFECWSRKSPENSGSFFTAFFSVIFFKICIIKSVLIAIKRGGELNLIDLHKFATNKYIVCSCDLCYIFIIMNFIIWSDVHLYTKYHKVHVWRKTGK